jgi:hypothetical protein
MLTGRTTLHFHFDGQRDPDYKATAYPGAEKQEAVVAISRTVFAWAQNFAQITAAF